MNLLAIAVRAAALVKRDRVRIREDGRVVWVARPWPRAIVCRLYFTDRGLNVHVFRGAGEVHYLVGSFAGVHF